MRRSNGRHRGRGSSEAGSCQLLGWPQELTVRGLGSVTSAVFGTLSQKTSILMLPAVVCSVTDILMAIVVVPRAGPRI